MKKTFGILILFILISLFLVLLFSFIYADKKILFVKENLENFLIPQETKSILFLGKMSGNHYGQGNTDAIFLLYLKDNHIFVIHIPRDLIVEIDGKFYKINSLYGLGKKEELLKEVTNFSGIKTNKYILIDSYLMRSVIDQLGGLKIKLIYPVTDAVSGYTLKPGTYTLSGEWVEFVARSRYYPDGDFTRMKNQFIIMKSLKEQLMKEPLEKLLKIAAFVINSKNHYETNLSLDEIVKLIKKISKIPSNNIHEIHIGYDKNIWQDGNYEIFFGSQNYLAYGLFPKNGVGEYTKIREIIREKIKEKIAQKP